MSKIKTLGDAMVLTSTVKLEDIMQLAKYNPKALVIVEPKTEDEIFRITPSFKPSFGKAGAAFNTANADGFAEMTILLPAGLSNEEKLTWIKECYGVGLLELNKIETTIASAVAELNGKFDTMTESITIG